MAKSPDLICALCNERGLLRGDVVPVVEWIANNEITGFKITYYEGVELFLTEMEFIELLGDNQLRKQTERLEGNGNGECLLREANQIGEVIQWLEEIDDGE